MKVNKVGKTSIGLFACLLILLSLSKAAVADIIWEPNDDFYMNSKENFINISRSYTTNSSEGSVEVKKNPKSNTTIATIDNGESFFVSFTYTDKNGADWGVIELDVKTGWVLMNDMRLIYDNIAFMEDNANKLKEYSGEFDDYEFKEGPVLLWTYPGSGAIAAEIKERNDMVSFSKAYTDLKDRLWGYISYYYGSEGWVCLSDPTNQDIPVTKPEAEATIIPPNSEQDSDIANTSGNNEVVLLIGLVVAVIAVTVVIIRIFWKKKG